MAITSFNGKVAAITGAGSGMGQQLAVLLSRAGCNLSLSDVSESGLEQTISLLADGIADGIKVTNCVVDVADRGAMESFASQTVADHGRVNMIFNNAGVSVTGSAEHMPYEDFEWLMNINFWGVVHGCKAFLPHLRQVDEAAIINTSSIFGTIAVPSQSAYNASKFAVRGYSFSLRQELAATHIGVSCIQPGGVKTNIVNKSRFIPDSNQSLTKDEMAQEFNTKMARLTSEQAAEQILRGVLRNKARILVGTDAKIASWLERIAPVAYLKLMKPFS